MTVEFVCVGTELLLGNIVNTNAAYLAEQCAGLGLSCYYQSVVGDNAERLEGVLRTALGRSDIVILSGGLGPTEDDLTKETAARVCGRRLVVNDGWMEKLAEYFAVRNMTPTENNWKQAQIPEGAILLDNPNGTAPGIIIEEENTRVILLPGPPNELIPLFEQRVKPYLAALTPGVICSQTLKICGVGESKAETMILDLIDAQTNPTLATYAKTGEVHIRVTAAAQDEEQAHALLAPMVRELENRFGTDLYTTREDVTLEQAVVQLLGEREMTLTCAESCTGGLLTARLVNVPGVSGVLKLGLVTYANKAKRKQLGVKKSTLQKYGAVSSQTAEEMVRGAAYLHKTDAAVSITGIAGPDGGTRDKPVGLVYMGCFVRGHVEVKEYRFSGSRAKVRESAAAAALTFLRQCVLRYA